MLCLIGRLALCMELCKEIQRGLSHVERSNLWNFLPLEVLSAATLPVVCQVFCFAKHLVYVPSVCGVFFFFSFCCVDCFVNIFITS